MSAPRRGIPALAAFARAGRLRGRRDSTRMLALFLLPVAVLTVIGMAIGGYAEPSFSVGILDHANDAASARLVERIDANPHLRARPYSDRTLLESAVFRGRLVGALEIPRGWRPGVGPTPGLQISESTPGAPVLRALLEAELAAEAAGGEPNVAIATLPVGAGEVMALATGFQYTAPANVVLFLVIHAMASALLLVELRANGNGRRLLATPARRRELVLALSLAPAQSMLTQIVFLIGVTGVFFGVGWGNPLGVALVSAALLVFCLAAALCMGTVFRSVEQCLTLGPLIGLILGMLGGCMWPLTSVPELLRSVSRFVPTTWALDAYLSMIFQHATVSDVLPAVGVLLAMAAVLGAIGVARLRSVLAG